MPTTGRNDPCPCGSGKKYKKCCLQTLEQQDFEYRRQRKSEADLIPLLFEFASSMLKETALEDAWIEFNGDDEIEDISADDPMNMIFMPWFFFSWTFNLGTYLVNAPPDNEIDEDDIKDFETTIVEMLVETLDQDLSEDQRAFLKSAGSATYTLCEVLEVRPTSGMKLRDLLREREFDVIEHSASQSLKRGEIIYCAPITIGGVVSNLSTSPYALRPTSKLEVLNAKRELLSELKQQTLDDDDLFAFEADFRYLYLELLASMFAPPQLVNTNQEPFVPQRVYFNIDSTDEAFHKLKDLAGESYQEQLLKNATIKRKRVVEAEIPWLQVTSDSGEEHGGQVLLGGVIRIQNEQLVVEVNSNDRAEQIQAIVAERLGDHCSYKMTSISPIEETVEQLWEQAKNSRAASEGVHHKSFDAEPSSSQPEDLDPNSPEVQALLKKLADEHWSTWYDIPVPALDNRTPREAALTPEGRDLLESLLLYYEIELSRNPDNNAAPDLPSIRRELGME